MFRILKLIKNIFRSKSFDKVLAFLLSFFLWLFVVSGKSITDKTILRISYKINPIYSFVDPPSKTLAVRYQGPRALWGKISEGKIVEIDLSKFKRSKKRKQFYKIKRDDLPFVQGLNLVDFDIKKIFFSLDYKKKRKLPVILKKMGTLNKDLVIDSISMNPTRLELNGANSLLKELKNISTEWIDLSDLTEGNFQKKLRLNIPANINSNVDMVDLSIDLRKIEAEKVEKIVPISFISRGESFKAKSLNVKVIYQQSSGSLINVNTNISAFVQIPKNFSGQKIWAPVKIDVPKGIKVIEYTPRRVEVFD
jgi:YbbR domain-containing protein